MKKIEFVDLKKQYKNIKKEVDYAVKKVIENASFVRGPDVDQFEQQYAELLQIENCISCANGTDSLFIAMKALGIKPGDEVICPAHSWISTSETITLAGAKVVFCDTNIDTYNIDVKQIESLITGKTVGIIPVHLFGQPADMDEILDIAKKHNLWILEDCAQAHLAKYKNKLVGTIGDVGSFSFYPGKNLGAMGDAGCIITKSEKLANHMTRFARHGGLFKGEHLIEGINSRMDGIQAAILNVKINYIEEWTAKRQAIANVYLQRIENAKISLPCVSDDRTHAWHLFVIKTDYRNELIKYLKNKNIPTVINYPVALPFLTAYEYLRAKPSQYPNAYYNQSRILSIPIHPELDDEQIEYIINSINEF